MQNAAYLAAPFAASGSSSSTRPNSAAAFNSVDTDPASLSVIGVSAAWRKLVLQAQTVAPHLQIAAIEGESGAGKQTLARYLFSQSPLICTTFQRRDAREWLATEADSGTPSGFLYLDRVDLVAPPGQRLLLAVLKNLQDRLPGRAVVLVSTQTPLRQMAAQGLLLPDLAFRLTAIRFAIPPLRQRREDIAPLTQFLLDRLCRRYQQRTVSLGPGTLTALLQHNWPGNVRELASVLEAALLEAENSVIRPADLALCNPPLPAAARPAAPVPPTSADLSLDGVIQRHVQHVLELNHGNKLRAARQLAISRSTLYRLLANAPFLTH